MQPPGKPLFYAAFPYRWLGGEVLRDELKIDSTQDCSLALLLLAWNLSELLLLYRLGEILFLACPIFESAPFVRRSWQSSGVVSRYLPLSLY
ncbi:MAG: hypothetical protein V4568_19845 [Pseudomonadota bacterium]